MEYTKALQNNLTGMVSQSNEYSLRDKRLVCDLDIEVNEMMFHLTSDGHSVIITYKKLAEAFAVFKILAEITPSYGVNRKRFEGFLRINGLTIYIQNRHFGILGQHANKVLAWTVAVAGRFFSS